MPCGWIVGREKSFVTYEHGGKHCGAEVIMDERLFGSIRKADFWIGAFLKIDFL